MVDSLFLKYTILEKVFNDHFALILCLIFVLQPEHQQLIVDAGALPLLVSLLGRHKKGSISRSVNSVIRRAADAITNLAHENSNIKSFVRLVFLPFLFTIVYSS